MKDGSIGVLSSVLVVRTLERTLVMGLSTRPWSRAVTTRTVLGGGSGPCKFKSYPLSPRDITLRAEVQWGGPMRCHMARGGKEGTRMGVERAAGVFIAG